MELNIGKVKQLFEKESEKATSLGKLDELRIRFLGKKGLLTGLLKGISQLPEEDRPKAGKDINELKKAVQNFINEKKSLLEESSDLERDFGKLDISLPGTPQSLGTLHPITKVLGQIQEIFVSLGFRVAEGPEVETEYYNFEALNIPLDHP